MRERRDFDAEFRPRNPITFKTVIYNLQIMYIYAGASFMWPHWNKNCLMAYVGAAKLAAKVCVCVVTNPVPPCYDKLGSYTNSTHVWIV